MSMIENLENIKKIGIVNFISNEITRWFCSKCGGTICIRKGIAITVRTTNRNSISYCQYSSILKE